MWGIDLMKKYSIQRKILRYFIAFVGILVSLLWLFQVVFLDDFYRVIKKNSIKKIVDTIQSTWEKDGNITLDTYTRNNEIYIRLINNQGFVISESQSVHSPDIRPIKNEEMIRIFNIATNEGVQVSFDGKGRMPNSLSYALKLDDKTVILVQANLIPVNATADTLKIQLIIVSVVLLSVAIILSYLISKNISNPISNLNEDAKKLGDGNFDVVFEGKGYQEIEELSATLNQMKEDLEAVQKLQDELLGNVGHDLQTPLTMIVGYSELMMDMPKERTIENLEVIKKEADYLSQLVKDMMDLSRLQTGFDVVHLDAFEVGPVIHEVIERFKGTNNHEIKLIGDTQSFVSINKTHFVQIIYNLLGNAITYSDDGTPITINVYKKDEHIRIEVSDQGSGIPHEDLSQIWERYYRSDKSHTRSKQGSGLGLSIVKRIFELWSMPFGVTSEVNKGTTFWFEIKEPII